MKEGVVKKPKPAFDEVWFGLGGVSVNCVKPVTL